MTTAEEHTDRKSFISNCELHLEIPEDRGKEWYLLEKALHLIQAKKSSFRWLIIMNTRNHPRARSTASFSPCLLRGAFTELLNPGSRSVHTSLCFGLPQRKLNCPKSHAKFGLMNKAS
jgi:hypothetical protein